MAPPTTPTADHRAAPLADPRAAMQGWAPAGWLARLDVLGLHARRVRAAHLRMAARRERLADWLDGVDAGTFARNGFLLRRGLLPPEEFAALRAALLAHPPLAGAPIDAALRRALPPLAPLLDGRAWNGMTRYAAGRDKPPTAWLQTTAVPAVPSPERDLQTLLHTDGWRPAMKAWFFLCDVGHDDAALCVVPGSHRLTPARLAWESAQGPRGVARIDKAELAALGLGKPTRLVVPANTLLVLDAFGFHKRALPRRPGLCLEIRSTP